MSPKVGPAECSERMLLFCRHRPGEPVYQGKNNDMLAKRK